MSYFDREGNPLTLMDWATLYDDKDYRIVAVNTIAGSYVSTVWLGLDHSLGIGPPLIFETMIFDGLHDGDQWRYPTEDEALSGHDRVVAKLKDEVANART